MNDRMDKSRENRSSAHRDEGATTSGPPNDGRWGSGWKLPPRSGSRPADKADPRSIPESPVIHDSVKLLLRQNGDCSVLTPGREKELARQVVSARQTFLEGILSVEPIARACIMLVEEALERNEPYSPSSILHIATIDTKAVIAPIFEMARLNVRTARALLERCEERWCSERAEGDGRSAKATIGAEVQRDLNKVGVLLAEIPMRSQFTESFFKDLRTLAAKARVVGVVSDAPKNGGDQIDTGALWSLTKKQLSATFHGVIQSERLYLEAREELVRRNLLLVKSWASRYLVPGVSFDDLVQEGTFGLMVAVERFEPERGYRFSTYATQWVKQAILRHCDFHGKTVRVPWVVRSAMRMVERFKGEYRGRNGRNPTGAEITEALRGKTAGVKVDEEWLELCSPAAKPQVSLDQPFHKGSDDPPTLGNFCDRSESPETEVLDRLELEEMRFILTQGLATLDDRERTVLALRFGLNGSESHTLEEVGGELKVTRERVRQIQGRAIEKLRKRIGRDEAEE